MLFVHGWISARRMWYEVAARLNEAKITSHLLDLRGYGLSDRPPSGHHLQIYAQDVVAAIDAIDAPVTLVAHSMGGRIAQYVACEYPRNVERLILVAPGAPGGPRVSKRRMETARHAYGSRDRIRAFQRAAMSVQPAEEVMQRIVDDALVAQPGAWFGDPERPAPIDFSDRLSEIAIPTLCLAGEKDPLAPPARVKADVASKIPGALLVTLRGVGHNLPVEASAEVAAAIERFYAKSDEAGLR